MKRLFIIPIFFLASFLIAVYFVLPAYQEGRQLVAMVEKREKELENRKDYFARLARLAGEKEKYQKVLDNINKALPPQLSVPSLFDFTQSQATVSGLILRSVSLAGVSDERLKIISEETSQTRRLKEARITVETLGPLGSFANFIKDLERSERFIEVEAISVEGEATEGEEVREIRLRSGMMRMILLFKAYAY